MPPLASAIAWKAAWCSRTPSTVTHSSSLLKLLFTRVSHDSAAASATDANTKVAATNATTTSIRTMFRFIYISPFRSKELWNPTFGPSNLQTNSLLNYGVHNRKGANHLLQASAHEHGAADVRRRLAVRANRGVSHGI